MAATAAAQPRRLTGLWGPRISRKTTAATAMRNPVAATLNVTFIAACLRTTAKTKRAPAAALRTSRSGVKKANPIRSGASSSGTSVVLPR